MDLFFKKKKSVLLDDITKRDSLLNDSYGSSRLCCVGVVGFVGFMLKAGKAGSVSCKTTVALLGGGGSRFDTGEGGPSGGGVSRNGCWLLCRAGSLLWPLILPPPHASLILFIRRGLSKCEVVGIAEVTNCLISVWNSHCSLQDLETQHFLQELHSSAYTLGHGMSPLGLRGTAPRWLLLCNNKRSPATAFLPAQRST